MTQTVLSTRGRHLWLIRCFLKIVSTLVVFVTTSMPGFAADRPLAAKKVSEFTLAEQALLQGRIDEAVTKLQALVAANGHDGPAQLLLCRAFYAEDLVDNAIPACERAVQSMNRSSEAEDWAGRAYGMKAASAGPLSGFSLARKVKAAFEEAVALDPHNGDAVNDLSEYYLGAPSVVGGGIEKADALADRVANDLPQQAHRIRALTAEKRKDYATAEREFRAAVDVKTRPDAWADLGDYYRRRKQDEQAVDALRHCMAVDHAHDASIVDAASILNEMHREPQMAEQALRQYLAGNAKTDAAPAIKVHVMLGKMLQAAGDKAGAKIEFQASLSSAANYAPAKKALHDL